MSTFELIERLYNINPSVTITNHIIITTNTYQTFQSQCQPLPWGPPTSIIEKNKESGWHVSTNSKEKEWIEFNILNSNIKIVGYTMQCYKGCCKPTKWYVQGKERSGVWKNLTSTVSATNNIKEAKKEIFAIQPTTSKNIRFMFEFGYFGIESMDFICEKNDASIPKGSFHVIDILLLLYLIVLFY